MLQLFAFAGKHFKRTKRSHCIFVSLLASTAIGVLHYPQSALAQSSFLTTLNPDDFVCYMQTIDGRVLNLNKLCGAGKGNASAFSTTDQRFLDRFQSLLKQRSTGLPSVKAALSQTQQNPQAVLQRAQAVCTALRTGQSQPSTIGQVGDDLFTTMAPKYYCPDLDD